MVLLDEGTIRHSIPSSLRSYSRIPDQCISRQQSRVMAALLSMLVLLTASAEVKQYINARH